MPFSIRHVGLTLFRQASKDDADAKATEKKRVEDVRNEMAILATVVAADAEDVAKSLEALGAVPSSGVQLASVVAKARVAADKADSMAKVATGALPAKKRARAAALKTSKKSGNKP